MAVSRRLRYEILRRDDYSCRYCGGRAPDVQLTVDHVIPVTLGGSDEPGNLVAACTACNAGKSSVNPDQPLVEQVSADALRWAAAMREAASIQDDSRYLVQSYRETFLNRWNTWIYGADQEQLPLPSDWPDSLEQFWRAGLEIEVVVEMVDRAGRSKVKAQDVFRYFCGCCWTTLRERQEIARSFLTVEDGESE